jgi:replicative DNA helicase
VAVDYAQIISAQGKDIREQVTRVAFRLRDFAKAEKVAVVLLSQSPRPEGRNINAKPNMHSLKESGSLEEAAHVIVLPYRPMDTETSKFTGADELIIGKNRNGVLDSINVTLNGHYLKFEER